jgi:hypothetical protein
VPKVEAYESLTATSTTRRTIVKTGAKIAYSAPLVAATMKLGSAAASALSHGDDQCDFNEGCGSDHHECSTVHSCGCVKAIEGGPNLCYQHFNAEWGTCITSAQCIASFGAGFFCTPADFCLGSVCAAPCGTPRPQGLAGAQATPLTRR